jgi:uncharacterized RDD family membrane protein YckC
MSIQPSNGERYRFCPECGTEATVGASFCGDCGSSLTRSLPQPSGDDAVSSRPMTSTKTYPPPLGPPSGPGYPPPQSPYTHPERSYQQAPQVSARNCQRCGAPLSTDRIFCQACNQVFGLPVGLSMASPLQRLGQYLLDLLLILVTLFIGWLIWSLVVYSDGQSPAMRLLKMHVIEKSVMRRATWGTMALRNLFGQIVIFGIIDAVFAPAALVLDFMLLWDRDRQQLWDKIAGTIVVSEPKGVSGGRLPDGSQGRQMMPAMQVGARWVQDSSGNWTQTE